MNAAAILPTALREVFLGNGWGTTFQVLRGAMDPSRLLSSTDITSWLDASLLKWPYFTLLKRGAQPATASYTQVRDVIGHKTGGFADGAAIRRYMTDGATLKLNQLSDWHRPTRNIVRELEADLPVAVNSYVFWTPSEQRGMLPHRDAAHVIAIQLEGRKEWDLYAEPGQVGAGAGLDVDISRPSHVFTLEPGDVLYLPHGWPHDAAARDGDSLHLTFTLTEPTPENLVEALLRRFLNDEWDLVHRFHARSLEARAREVRTVLLEQAKNLPDALWISTALDTMREALT